MLRTLLVVSFSAIRKTLWHELKYIQLQDSPSADKHSKQHAERMSEAQFVEPLRVNQVSFNCIAF